MMLALWSGFIDAALTAPKKLRPSLPAQPVILALLTALVETLDQALRPA
jgi:hypothetical protein